MARFFTYALLLISQLDSRLNPSLPHLLTWIIGLAGEAVLLAARVTAYENNQQKKAPGKRHIKWNSWEILDISVDSLRAFLLLILICIYVALVVAPRPATGNGDTEETTGLLANGSSPGSSDETDYGAIPGHQKSGHSGADAPAGWGRRTVVGKQSWWEYLRGYAIFFPYLWPSKNRRLQVMMIICFGLVALQRLVNVMVPHQLGRVTDLLSEPNGMLYTSQTKVANMLADRY